MKELLWKGLLTKNEVYDPGRGVTKSSWVPYSTYYQRTVCQYEGTRSKERKLIDGI